jgi:hypothetical protein
MSVLKKELAATKFGSAIFLCVESAILNAVIGLKINSAATSQKTFFCLNPSPPLLEIRGRGIILLFLINI